MDENFLRELILVAREIAAHDWASHQQCEFMTRSELLQLAEKKIKEVWEKYA